MTGFGLVAPAETFEAIAQVGGTVAWVNPELARGAVLPAGAELLRIAPDDYDLALAQAEANTRAAQAKLAELAVSADNQRAALEIERDVLTLRADELARVEALREGGSRAQAAVDTARAAWLAQRQKVQSIESTLALIPSQRVGLEANTAAARAAGETARLNRARTTLTLPFAARVAQVSVEEGRFLRVGEVAAVLDGIAQAEVEAQIPVTELRRLLRLAAPDAAAFAADPAAMTAVLRGLGLGAQVRLDLGDDALSWPGRVDRVSDTIDPKTGTLGVIVVVDAAYTSAVPGAQPPLTKGMFVEVGIAGRPVSGLAVPRSALW
ncbi:MAG TPA: efflux RND transporter periplasmic adaptor subunit, partial [Rhodobacteraceae bacterium]|nr:efflux RND transporter periplasmic adaptor subunit [Paracoccaceae bacterium]